MTTILRLKESLVNKGYKAADILNEFTDEDYIAISKKKNPFQIS